MLKCGDLRSGAPRKSRGHRVVGGRDDGLEPKGGGGGGGGGVGPGGRSIATGLGRNPVGGCYSAEMRRPAIRSTAHDPMRLLGVLRVLYRGYEQAVILVGIIDL